MTHVLVTRPLDSSRQLAEELKASGLTPVVMPMYSFVKRLPDVDIQAVWSEKSLRKLAVFTSPRAVQFGLPFMPSPDQMDDLEIAVVGAATRAKLVAAGYPVHVQAATGFTSEDLLQVPRLADDPGQAIIFCAPGGREALFRGLGELGWKTSKAMVYEREAVRPEAIQLEKLRAADKLISIWTSISALKIAQQYLPADVWGKILASSALVISIRIQHHLEQLGASGVKLAGGPGNPELLRSVQRLVGQQSVG